MTTWIHRSTPRRPRATTMLSPKIVPASTMPYAIRAGTRPMIAAARTRPRRLSAMLAGASAPAGINAPEWYAAAPKYTSAFTTVRSRSVPPMGSVAVLFESREAVGFVLLGQGVDEIVDVAVQPAVQVREVVAEAPVGETVLWEVVRAHLLRPLASVLGTRWTRCTPDSNFSFEYAPRPVTLKMTSLKPPFSAWLAESSSTFQRCRSA